MQEDEKEPETGEAEAGKVCIPSGGDLGQNEVAANESLPAPVPGENGGEKRKIFAGPSELLPGPSPKKRKADNEPALTPDASPLPSTSLGMSSPAADKDLSTPVQKKGGDESQHSFSAYAHTDIQK